MMGAIFDARVYLSGGGILRTAQKPVRGRSSTRNSDNKRYPGPCEAGTCESGVSSYTRQPDQRGKP